MKVRKIVAALAAVSMLAAVSAQAVLAADTVTVTAEKVTAAPGAEFTLNVELSGVPAAGISVCDFAVSYDASVVSVTGVEAGAITNKGADGAENFEGATAFDADYSTAGVINVTYTTGLEDSAYWITDDGVFLTIKGTVAAGAADGTVSDVKIVPVDRKVNEDSSDANASVSIGCLGADYAVTKYDAKVVDGSVTVKAETPSDDTTESTPPGDLTYGDVNCDGKVTINDVILLNKALLAGEKLTDQGALNADVNQNGNPDATDSLNILKYTIKLVTEFPV